MIGIASAFPPHELVLNISVDGLCFIVNHYSFRYRKLDSNKLIKMARDSERGLGTIKNGII